MLSLLALQTSLFDLWHNQWGVGKSQTDKLKDKDNKDSDLLQVGGHSLGELSAAYAAGLYTLEDVVQIGRFLARVMDASGEGWMASGVGLSSGSRGVAVASKNFVEDQNGGTHVTVCGVTKSAGSLESFLEKYPNAKPLQFVNRAWHHQSVKEEVLNNISSKYPDLSQMLESLPPGKSSGNSIKCPVFVSSAGGRPLNPANVGKDFWLHWLSNAVDMTGFRGELEKINKSSGGGEFDHRSGGASYSG